MGEGTRKRIGNKIKYCYRLWRSWRTCRNFKYRRGGIWRI